MVLTVGETRTVRSSKRLRGTLSIPGDKSITHRALIFNAIAEGDAVIEGWLDSADTRSTIACLRDLGATIEERDDGRLIVHGRGRAGLQEPSDVLDCGNSGTSMRLLTGLVAGLPMLTVLTGDDSLRRRPMARVLRPLRQLGVVAVARAEDTLPPVVIQGGPTTGGQTLEPPVASAQVKSAILLAGLAADGPTTVRELAATRDHTERMLGAMGAGIALDGTAVTLTPPAGELQAVGVRVPADISTAAPWIVAAAAHPDAELTLTGVGINPTRTGILDILRAMGADITLEEERTVGGEPVADIVVRSSELRGTRIDGDLIPRAVDELPLAALAGALATGETVIAEAAELRAKESDRIATTSAMLRAFGVTLEEREDGLTVQGGARLRGATVDSSGDHRLAMLGGIAGVFASGETHVTRAEAVHVSYPDFWADLDRCTSD